MTIPSCPEHKTPMTVSGWTEEDLKNALDAHFRCQEPGCDKHCLVLDGEEEYLPHRVMPSISIAAVNPQ
ncbi:MAG: hypothetical protein WA715_27800 [Candidatus Acidiferrum sp.]|jgi:hypothetical protein